MCSRGMAAVWSPTAGTGTLTQPQLELETLGLKWSPLNESFPLIGKCHVEGLEIMLLGKFSSHFVTKESILLIRKLMLNGVKDQYVNVIALFLRRPPACYVSQVLDIFSGHHPQLL